MLHPSQTDRRSWLWLAIGAILLFFSSLQPSLPMAAWLAPVFLIRFTRTQRPRVGLPVLALVSSVVLFSNWAIGLAPVTMFGISGALAALLMLLGYLADRLLAPQLRGLAATLVFPLASTTVDWLGSMLAGPLSASLLPSLFSAGATWDSPAYTQAGNLALLQIVSVTGLWGLTFLITWLAPVVNAVWAHNFDWRPARRSVFGFSAVLVGVLLFGSARLAFFPSTAPTVRVAGIVSREDLFTTIADMNPQALMPGTPAMRSAAQKRFAPIVDDLFARSQQEAANGAKIIVWGETAAPVLAEEVATVLGRAGTLAQARQIYLQVGLIVFRNSDHFPFMENRAVLLDPTGAVVWDYHKARPTPGENTMVVAGPPLVPTVDTPYGRLATVICYDADFPELVRQVGRAGVDILLLPYKDWHSVKIQHAQMATLRAIENGVSLVRPSLSGLSTAVDPQGRILAQVDAFATEAPTLVTMVATHGMPTLYPWLGDSFAYCAWWDWCSSSSGCVCDEQSDHGSSPRINQRFHLWMPDPNPMVGDLKPVITHCFIINARCLLAIFAWGFHRWIWPVLNYRYKERHMSTFLSSALTQPTPQPTRLGRRLFGWLKRGLLGLLISLVALAGVGAIYQAVATAYDLRTFLPPGQLVDVGGYKLHIYCTGPTTSDSPTVILEPGLGATASAWAWIQPAVAKTARVCAYDLQAWGGASPRLNRMTHNTSPKPCTPSCATPTSRAPMCWWAGRYGGLYIARMRPVSHGSGWGGAARQFFARPVYQYARRPSAMCLFYPHLCHCPGVGAPRRDTRHRDTFNRLPVCQRRKALNWQLPSRQRKLGGPER